MRDVAALAGVSIKTVSRVVNHQPGAGPDVVRRVREAAASLGYRPNLTASSLRRSDRRSATLGVVVENLSNPFDAALLRAVEERASRDGVLVLGASDEDDPRRQQELLDSLASRRVDGLVVMPVAGDQEALHVERQRGTPMVLVDRPATFAGADSVTVTNRRSSCEVVLELAARGHRDIAYLGDRETLWTSQERLAGFVEGMAKAGCRLREELVRTGLRGALPAERAALELLDLDRPPTAFYTAQNLVTVGALQALRGRGLQHRVAIVGFDDFPLADLLDPAVTVVRQDLATVGTTAADLVLRRVEGDATDPVHVVVPATLVRRGSGELPAPGRA
jgi:LacI family transcriptional regulator